MRNIQAFVSAMAFVLMTSGLSIGMTFSFAQANALQLPAEVKKGGQRIILMLKGDVGLEAARPIDPSLLNRLSLKAGVELTWEGNTRTNGQILGMPIGIKSEQAKMASEQLSLEPGVLWAEVEETFIMASKSATGSLQDQGDGEEITRFIVKLKGDDLSRNLNPVLLEKLESAVGVKLTVTGRTTFARILKLDAPVTVDQAAGIEKALESISEVIYADPDRRVYPQSRGEIAPNDPLFWRNWHLQGPYPLPDGWTNGYLGAANVQAAWALTKGKPSVAVAVVDTGILFDHPDLKRSLGRQTKKRGWDMVTDIASARDSNARDPDAQDEGDWKDVGTTCAYYNSNSSWHGSHVAGIIAATTNNRIGVSGVNWKAKIVPVRIFGACGTTIDAELDGIYWASGHRKVPGTSPNKTPVKAMNLSYGGGHRCYDGQQEAIDYALVEGVSVVASAGNRNSDNSQFPSAPANCRGVISVVSVNHLGDKADYSNYGSVVTIAAPGGQTRWPVYDIYGNEIGWSELREWGIWSTVSSSLTTSNLGDMTYEPYQGTSMAAPVVTGVISLMVSVEKNIS